MSCGVKKTDDRWIESRLEKALGADSEHLAELSQLVEKGEGFGKRLVQAGEGFNVRQLELDASANKGREL